MLCSRSGLLPVRQRSVLVLRVAMLFLCLAVVTPLLSRTPILTVSLPLAHVPLFSTPSRLSAGHRPVHMRLSDWAPLLTTPRLLIYSYRLWRSQANLSLSHYRRWRGVGGRPFGRLAVPASAGPGWACPESVFD